MHDLKTRYNMGSKKGEPKQIQISTHQGSYTNYGSTCEFNVKTRGRRDDPLCLYFQSVMNVNSAS